jgi:hypothetical protein
MTPPGVIKRYPTDISEEALVFRFAEECEATISRFEQNVGSYWQTARLHSQEDGNLVSEVFSLVGKKSLIRQINH